jgi:UDP-glucose-4-epimerase GalE
VWAKKFLEYQGYWLSVKKFYQDNESTIWFEKNGRKSCGPNSRHIDIRYFFIKDGVGYEIQYCPTEQMLADFHHAYGLKHICLRYFNAAGADPECEIGEDHRPETHLIPLILQAALGKKEAINIFGDDYPTPDGTCIRDYIHVYDLAQAHLLALEKLLNGFTKGQYNLGNGEGHSVKEVIKKASKITGQAIPVKITGRRPGDPAVLIGSSKRAIEALEWKPQFADIVTIIETAGRWHKNHPDGY